jgi:hypothetical protein
VEGSQDDIPDLATENTAQRDVIHGLYVLITGDAGVVLLQAMAPAPV